MPIFFWCSWIHLPTMAFTFKDIHRFLQICNNKIPLVSEGHFFNVLLLLALSSKTYLVGYDACTQKQVRAVDNFSQESDPKREAFSELGLLNLQNYGQPTSVVQPGFACMLFV